MTSTETVENVSGVFVFRKMKVNKILLSSVEKSAQSGLEYKALNTNNQNLWKIFLSTLSVIHQVL